MSAGKKPFPQTGGAVRARQSSAARHCFRVIFPRLLALALAVAALPGGASGQGAAPLRAPVHPRRNVEEFAPVEARWLRFTISRTNGGYPCLDEWEVYGPDQPARNLALADMGTRVAASGTMVDYRIHALRHVNDGLYGNAHSWIADAAEGWVELELPQVERVSRIVWSRDRLGKFTDRLATEYRIEIAREPGRWQLVASSAERQPLDVPVPAGLGFISASDRFAPWAGEITAPPALAALAGERITAIVCDADGRVWLGTGARGIARLDGGHLTRWTVAEGLAGNAVRTLRVDAAGTLWAGIGAGLSRWRDGRFESFTARQGLPDEVVSQILDDTAGHLWLGTNRGVLRVPHRSFEDVSAGRAGALEVLSLDKGDGLPSLECTGGFHPSGLRLRDGRLCFGTVAGLAIVDPARFANPPAAPPVIIEEMAVGNHPPTPPDAVTAPFADNARSAKFRFTALSYTAPQRVRFRYRLEGLQTGWTAAGPERTAAYEFLPPGSFRFRVQASREGSAWSEAGVAFRIPAPWWRTPWAGGAAIVAGGGAVAGAVRFITRRRLQRRLRIVEEKLALERERSRIARDIHDQLGANLTHIALLSAGGRDCSPEALRERFTAIAASSNELVQAVDAIVWAVNPRHGNLESLARYLTRFAEDFLAPAAPRLRLDVPVELPDAPLSPELRHNAFLATREALNNCVRHAAATEVHLRIRVAGNVLTIVIGDDGLGFAGAGSGDGDGLGNMRRRLAESGGVCDISSAPGRGTTVTFTLPLSA